jgi:sirohydrochlorin ferrochelatase
VLTIKEGILLLAHGSRREEANDEIRCMARLIQARDPDGIYETAYMSFGTPDISGGIENLIAQGIEIIIIMPLFLVTGNHITHDIPEEIALQKERFPGMEFRMAQHLACHPAIVDIVMERLGACTLDKRMKK